MRASMIHHHRSRHLHHDDQCQTKQINYKPQFSAPDHQTHWYQCTGWSSPGDMSQEHCKQSPCTFPGLLIQIRFWNVVADEDKKWWPAHSQSFRRQWLLSLKHNLHFIANNYCQLIIGHANYPDQSKHWWLTPSKIINNIWFVVLWEYWLESAGLIKDKLVTWWSVDIINSDSLISLQLFTIYVPSWELHQHLLCRQLDFIKLTIINQMLYNMQNFIEFFHSIDHMFQMFAMWALILK